MLFKGVELWILIAGVVDLPGCGRDLPGLAGDGQGHGPDVPIVAVGGDVVVVDAPGREHCQQPDVLVAVAVLEAGVDLLVPPDHQVAADLAHERPELLAPEGEAGARGLEVLGDHVGAAGVEQTQDPTDGIVARNPPGEPGL